MSDETACTVITFFVISNSSVVAGAMELPLTVTLSFAPSCVSWRRVLPFVVGVAPVVLPPSHASVRPSVVQSSVAVADQ